MPNPTLFPLTGEPQSPAPNRTKPGIWLKRLVILSSLDSSKKIRNLKFRRGLNVIQTKKIKNRSGSVAGYGVGKTLLMRLIRYSLGEAEFGTEATEAKILESMKSLVVVAHWSVAGQSWIVVRPLNDREGKLSFASKHDHWQPVVDRKCEETQYQTFVSAINQSVLSALPAFKLLRGREAGWLDLLAWLSRDYQCGYRFANEWRHRDANLGSYLYREDNSLIMQWAMGLMSDEEIGLRIKHRELLKQRSLHKEASEGQQLKLETLWPPLREKLDLPDDVQVESQQKTFDSFRPADFVDQQVRTLEQRKQSERRQSTLSDLQDSLDKIRTKLSECRTKTSACDTLIKFFDGQIADCKADDRVTDLRQRREDQAKQLKLHEASQKQYATEFAAAKTALEAEGGRLAEVVSSIDQEIGRWKGFLNDAKSFQDLSDSMAANARQVLKVESAIERSLQLQESLRGKKRAEIGLFSEVYQQLLQKIFGEGARGSIKVDGHGLHPAPDEQLTPAGAALSVMTTVVAFDIASLSTSVRGIGQHPRFLMHDSPRDGDVEASLFAKLFEIVRELEQEFEDPDTISFQYIVTTTTSPPDSAGIKPFVVETLDARKEKGLLLKQRF